MEKYSMVNDLVIIVFINKNIVEQLMHESFPSPLTFF